MRYPDSDAALAAQLKALAHPARIAILRALLSECSGERGGCCCGDIVRSLPLAQSTVSQHLRVLLEAGLIRGTTDGPRSCYCADHGNAVRLARALAALVGDGGVSAHGMAPGRNVEEPA